MYFGPACFTNMMHLAFCAEIITPNKLSYMMHLDHRIAVDWIDSNSNLQPIEQLMAYFTIDLMKAMLILVFHYARNASYTLLVKRITMLMCNVKAYVFCSTMLYTITDFDTIDYGSLLYKHIYVTSQGIRYTSSGIRSKKWRLMTKPTIHSL